MSTSWLDGAAGGGAGSKSAATLARSNGKGAVDVTDVVDAFPGLRAERAAGVLRPRLEEPEGGGGRRPFWNVVTWTCNHLPLYVYNWTQS